MIHHINIQITDRQRTREWYEKVLDAEFLDRGPALNERQLQLRIGTGEIHTSDTPEVIEVPRVYFAIEVGDWDGMLAHLESLGVNYSRSAGGAFASSVGGDDPDGAVCLARDELRRLHGMDAFDVAGVTHHGVRDLAGAPDVAAPN